MQKTKIEWCDMTSNPIYAVDKATGKRGWFCERVSPGCAHCYASKLNVRRGTGHEYLPEHRDKVEFRLNERELEAILRRKKPTRIFMCDMLDLFHEDVPDEFIARIFATMALAPQHTFLLLTKRAERMRDYVSSRTAENERGAAFWRYFEGQDYRPYWPLPNVHLGVSVENQRFADERIPVLLRTPAAVHFISAEPLLGPLDLRKWLKPPIYSADEGTQSYEWPPLNQVIVAGESAGPPERRLVEWCMAHLTCRMQPAGRRSVGRDLICGECGALNRWRPKPEALAWVRSIRDQAVAASVPFFFKGWSGPAPTSGGRLLDGRIWDEYPGEEA